MCEVKRKDTFESADSIPSGYYQLYKNKLSAPEFHFDNIIVSDSPDKHCDMTGAVYCIIDPVLYDSIENGDIVSVNNKKMRIILSGKANHNTLLVTERCNNLCLFCSQPPKKDNDDWLLNVASKAIIAFKSKKLIGISGGEPLLYGNQFIEFLQHIKEYSPDTPLHILTNGRAFSDFDFTKKIAAVLDGMSVSFGIPLYSVSAERHDEITGSPGSFRETVSGMINAGNFGINIELRFIPVSLNLRDLNAVTEMAGRVFSNINQISVMNLEAQGWARKNWKKLYQEPERYKDDLSAAVQTAERCQLPIVLFNYPLCHIPETLWPYSVQSISDWKNYYPPACSGCRKMDECGGYFSSSYGKYHQLPRAFL